MLRARLKSETLLALHVGNTISIEPSLSIIVKLDFRVHAHSPVSQEGACTLMYVNVQLCGC